METPLNCTPIQYKPIRFVRDNSGNIEEYVSSDTYKETEENQDQSLFTGLQICNTDFGIKGYPLKLSIKKKQSVTNPDRFCTEYIEVGKYAGSQGGFLRDFAIGPDGVLYHVNRTVTALGIVEVIVKKSTDRITWTTHDIANVIDTPSVNDAGLYIDEDVNVVYTMSDAYQEEGLPYPALIGIGSIDAYYDALRITWPLSTYGYPVNQVQHTLIHDQAIYFVGRQFNSNSSIDLILKSDRTGTYSQISSPSSQPSFLFAAHDNIFVYGQYVTSTTLDLKLENGTVIDTVNDYVSIDVINNQNLGRVARTEYNAASVLNGLQVKRFKTPVLHVQNADTTWSKVELNKNLNPILDGTVSPVKITTASAHGYKTGMRVYLDYLLRVKASSVVTITTSGIPGGVQNLYEYEVTGVAGDDFTLTRSDIGSFSFTSVGHSLTNGMKIGLVNISGANISYGPTEKFDYTINRDFVVTVISNTEFTLDGTTAIVDYPVFAAPSSTTPRIYLVGEFHLELDYDDTEYYLLLTNGKMYIKNDVISEWELEGYTIATIRDLQAVAQIKAIYNKNLKGYAFGYYPIPPASSYPNYVPGAYGICGKFTLPE